MNKTMITVLYEKESQILQFAASELKKYLEKLWVQVSILPYHTPDYFLKEIVLEVSDEFEVENEKLDDGYEICIDNLSGYIRGVNERSVLLGVYRFLKEIGFSFLRPGIFGEKAPQYLREHHVNLRELPSYRHRGICIEGAVSYENVLEMIDWLPKAGMNSYFTQFFVPYEFFRSWYEHRNNPYAVPEEVPSVEEAERFIRETVSEQMKLRGLLWHAAGHGITTAAVQVQGLGWDEDDISIVPEEFRSWLAEVSGERKLFGGIALNTHLCYSKPEVRERIANVVIEYLEKNPGVDVMHFWLADASNNSCECEACRRRLPADWYVEMLNLVDEKMTEKGLETKIVFLSYCDLLWPPKETRIQNEDRFLFMFAPISRSYKQALQTETDAEIPEFSLNHCKMPDDVEENLAFLNGWKQVFGGDSFIYDYHYMWNLFRDWGDFYEARVLWQDIRNLEEIGLNGYMSCQETRAFAPTGLGMFILSETLWKKEQDFGELVDKYFQLAYGEHGEEIRSYVEKLSRLSYEEQPESDRAGEDLLAAEKLEAGIRLTEEMRPRLEHFMQQTAGTDQVSYEYLLSHGQTAELYMQAMLERRRGNEEKAKAAYERLKIYLGVSEMRWQGGFDVYWFIRHLDPLFKK